MSSPKRDASTASAASDQPACEKQLQASCDSEAATVAKEMKDASAESDREPEMKPVTADDPNYRQPDDPLLLRFTRTVAAPRSRVWRAWTTPELAEWFVPEGKMHKSELDFRVAGQWRFTFNMGGVETPCVWEWVEIEPEQRLVLLDFFEDPAQPGKPKRMPGWPLQVKATISFREVAADSTEVCIEWVPQTETDEEKSGFTASRLDMISGWNLFFSKLDRLVQH